MSTDLVFSVLIICADVTFMFYRYMHKNREITRIKRDEIKRLKEYLTVLQQRLERYYR